jgi:protein-disulfide isomerase
LYRIRLFACFLLVAVAAGCHAQLPPSSSADRRIEVLVRSQFSVPPDYDVMLGGRTKSDIPDYDNLPVTFTHKGKQTTVNFLISKDGNTLARLEKFDISKDPAMSINVDKRPVRGDAAAKVEIINFDDLECPYCARMNSELATETMDHYKGLVKIVYKDYPLVDIHPWALHAAIDANCLADLSAPAYWNYVDYVHSHGQDISGAQADPKKSFTDLDNIAGTIAGQHSVDKTKLTACLQKQDDSSVLSSMKLGTTLGLEGTPQVFVNGERLPSGARPVEELWPAIDRALKAEGVQPPPEPAPATDKPAGQPGH